VASKPNRPIFKMTIFLWGDVGYANIKSTVIITGPKKDRICRGRPDDTREGEAAFEVAEALGLFPVDEVVVFAVVVPPVVVVDADWLSVKLAVKLELC